jgi:hypothetical protein
MTHEVYSDSLPSPRTGGGSDYCSVPQMPDPTVNPDECGQLFDPIVDSVVKQFWKRSQDGIKKYGSTLADSPLSIKDFIKHAREESMDLALYLETLEQKQVILEKIAANLLSFWAKQEEAPMSAEAHFGRALCEVVKLSGYKPRSAETQAILDYFQQFQ